MPAILDDLPTVALFVFLAFILAVIGLGLLLLRSSLGKSIGEAAATHAKTYATAYVKGTVLMLIAMIGSFEEAFRTLTSAAAAALPWWGWAILFLKPISAACAVLVAFLDKSIQRATEAKEAALSKSTPPFSIPST